MPCEGQADGAPTGEYANDCYDPKWESHTMCRQQK